MSFKSYPQYKSSGAAWLGDVPEGWQVVSAKSAFAERRRLSYPDDTHLTPSQIHGVLSQADYMALTGKKVVLNLSGSDAMRHVEPRDFISHLRSFQGGLELSRLRGKVSAAYTVLTPRRGIVASFFRYVFKSTLYVQALQTTTDQLRDGQSIRYGQFALIPLTIPPAAEQRQIADYLDAHTAKIDALIEKQEQLIETLAERRQAVISHAVTKGLEPWAETKESGQAWAGSIPASWNMKRVSWLFRTVGSGTTPTSGDTRYYGEGTPWVTTGELREQTIMKTSKSVTSEALSTFTSLRVYGPGTLLIAMYGATIGRLGVLGIEACTNQACCAMAGPAGVLTRFAHYSLLAAKEHILVLAVGGGQPNINQDLIRALRLPVPSLIEQQAIIEHLDEETTRMGALSAKAREVIDVLKERRQALISAAVTGKIDVRGLS